MRRLLLLAMSCLLTAQVLAASPNDLIAGALQSIEHGLDSRREELIANKPALYAFVDEILMPRFDRKLAAQLVLASHWRSAKDDERQRFIAAFYTTLLHRYADGLLEFDLSSLEILPFRGDETKKRTSVKTKVRLDDGTVVPVSYSLISRPEGWLFFDVVVEGISYLRNFRAEIDSEIRSTSLVAVIERLELEAMPAHGAE